MAIAKVILNGEVQMDVTSDTVEANKLLSGETATKNDGTKVTGTFVAPDPVISSLSITPTESAQTFNETSISGYKPVTVEAIASDYVGSAVPLKSSADLTISGSLFTAPSGYYSESAQSNMGSGFIQIGPSSKFMPNTLYMSVVSSTGYISYILQSSTIDTAGLLMDLSSGYVSADAQYFSFNDITLRSTSGTYLPDGMRTLSAQTITPTESVQYISSYRWLTGSQTIEAIASDYVGSAIPIRSAANMYANGSRVYAPSGYYSTTANAAVSSTSLSAITMAIISSTGNVTAELSYSAGYLTADGTKKGNKTLPTLSASTWTPGSTSQTISSYKWLTGSQTIAAIPSSYIIPSGTYSVTENGTYDIGSYASVDVSVSGGGGDVNAFIERSFSTVYFSNSTLTKIGSGAFFGLNGALRTISVPNVSIIGDMAFANAKLDYATASWSFNFKSVTSVGTGAFLGAFKPNNDSGGWISSDTFPVLSYIGSYAFATNKIYGIFPEVVSIGAGAFLSNGSGRLSFPKLIDIPSYAFEATRVSEIQSDNFPKAETIGQLAFANTFGDLCFTGAPTYVYFDAGSVTSNTTLKSVTFPLVKTIGSQAFISCTSLTSINFPECTTIETSAFANCYRLPSANFPKVTTIGVMAFTWCSSLTTISFPQCVSILGSAFSSCSKLTVADFPECTYIGSCAFSTCSSLATISFPECIDILSCAFFNCRALSIADFPKVTNIGYSAFAQCSILTTISFPECITISSSAFTQCGNLTTISFPQCTTIGQQAFANCTNLTEANFPECEVIHPYAFRYCNNLTKINFPACTVISGSFAFQNCFSLQSASFPLCTSIGSSAFYSCRALSIADFPVCTNIGATAFVACSNLTTISFPQCITIGQNAFANCTNLTEANFPECTSINSRAFNFCSNLTTASFPKCTYIGDSAFNGCSSLFSLYLTSVDFVPTLGISVFSGTRIIRFVEEVYGSIYVPASLYNDFLTATNWSSISARLVSV